MQYTSQNKKYNLNSIDDIKMFNNVYFSSRAKIIPVIVIIILLSCELVFMTLSMQDTIRLYINEGKYPGNSFFYLFIPLYILAFAFYFYFWTINVIFWIILKKSRKEQPHSL